MVRFAAWSGLRAAEVVGLHVEDARVLHAEVHVVRTVKRTSTGEHVGTPKSRTSTGRTVPIPPTLARQVAEHIAARGLGPDDYVFGDSDGGALRYSSWYHRVWIPARKKFGRPGLRFHDLRHTFASLKLGQGKGLHQLKDWMGHATVNVTIDLYGKWVREDEEARRAADDTAFLAAAAPAVVRALHPA